jgi:hypothetical protein
MRDETKMEGMYCKDGGAYTNKSNNQIQTLQGID